MDADELNKLLQQVGIYIAQGLDNEIIIKILDGSRDLGLNSMNEHFHPFKPIPTEEAVHLLRGIYDGWRDVNKSLELLRDDLVNWHIRQRTQLLRKALCDDGKEGQRTALTILESLARIQSLTDDSTIDLKIPCRVEFVIPTEKTASAKIEQTEEQKDI